MLSSILGILLPILFGIGGTWLSNKVNAGQLTGAEQQQNAFNAQQAEVQRQWSAEQNAVNNAFNAAEAQKNRDFQAGQAQNQMDFQERMDNTVYQRRVADMQAAGVNPALAVGGISVGSTSGAAGSGSQASASPLSGSSASGSGRGVPQSMSDIMQAAMFRKSMEQIDSQIQVNDAKTMRDMAEAGLLGSQTVGQNLANSWFEPMHRAQLDNLLSDLKSKESQRRLNDAHISQYEAETALTVTQTAIAHIDEQTRGELNRASIRLQMAQASLAYAQSNESRERIGLIHAEINELYQRAITESMQAGYYSAAELESMERAGLIKEQKGVAAAEAESLGLQNELKKYEVDHKGLTYWLNTAQKTMDVAMTPINVGSQAFGRVAGVMSLGNLGSSYVPSSSRAGSGLWLPSGSNSFDMHYNFNR